MECLHCGDCCKRMSPISSPDPCPYMERVTLGGEEFFFCRIYDNRPAACANHQFPSRFCPVGIDVLRITEAGEVARRIDRGWEYLCHPV